MPRLFGELVRRNVGPILVIGGGPSAPESLHEISDYGVKPEAVLSANEHGLHQKYFDVTHVVAADGVHQEARQRMDEYLATRHTKVPPLISPAHFADYRLPAWQFAANTGLQAIALAVAMGGNPVIVAGVDFFRLQNENAATYFHDRTARSSSNTKSPVEFEHQVAALQRKLGTEPYAIRPMAGPLTIWWPGWDPNEDFAAQPRLPEFATAQRRMITHVMRATGSPWTLAGMAVERGAIVACSQLEANLAMAARQAVLVESREHTG